MRVDTGDRALDVIVEVASGLADNVVTCLGPIDPELGDPVLLGYDEPQPKPDQTDTPADPNTDGLTDQPTDTATDPQFPVDPVLLAYDEPQPTPDQTDVPADPNTDGLTDQPTDAPTDPEFPVDPVLLAYDEPQPKPDQTDTPADPNTDGLTDQTTDTPIDPQTVVDPVLTISDPVKIEDGAPDGSDAGSDVVVIVDPMPEWRLLDGEAGIDILPVFCCGPVDWSTDTIPSVIDPAFGTEVIAVYMLADNQPLIDTVVVLDVAPGRSPVPLPYERAGSAPMSMSAPTFAPEQEIDRTPVHYAVSEPFHTGLDLL